MATSNNTKRPGMTINPLMTQPGGLASRGQSVVDTLANASSEAKEAVQDWTKAPAERVAASIEGQDAQTALASAPAPAEVQTPAQPPSEAVAPGSAAAKADADGVIPDDDDPFAEAHVPAPKQRNLKPWTEKAKDVAAEVGTKGKGTHFRLNPDVYAKTWFLKEITPGMTWDKLADAALERFVNRRLKELGYDV